MTSADRIAIIYAASVVGALGLSWHKGTREPQDLIKDALIHGGMIGTGFSVIAWLADDAQVALNNRGHGKKDCKPTGNISSKGIGLLSAINPDILYKTAKLAGLEIGPAPTDPNIVKLPKS
jgi:hypothetical protein